MSVLDDLPDIFADAFDDVFYDAVLTREVPGASSDAADPVAPTTTDYTCKALAVEYNTGLVMKGLVAATDVNVLILAATLSVEPKSLDRVVITDQGVNGTIVPAGTDGLKAVEGDPSRSTWQCRVMK